MKDLGLSEQGLADLRHLVATRPRAFWRALTPAQALGLLRAAPKVAGPRVDGLRDAFVVHDTCVGAASAYRSEAEADAALRAAGWLLVPDAGGEGE